MDKKRTVGIFLGGWILGLALTGAYIFFFHSQTKVIFPTRIRAPHLEYKFINPLLAVDIPEATLAGLEEYKTLKKNLAQTIETEIQNGRAQKISTYFRELLEGRWVGINEEEGYSPASLLKVPLLIAYLKLAESDPALLSQKITHIENSALAASALSQPKSNLKPGQTYTIDELLREMIIRSDNKALALLTEHIDQSALQEIFSDLGLTAPTETSGSGYFISAKTYSLFFRILYNSTYLNRAMSERALDLLSQAEFRDGLAAGVPQAFSVAHKFGLSSIEQNGAITGIELHDCGIIYKPSHPYLLCVMTKGTDLANLKTTVQNVSRTVYDQINQEKN